MAKHFEKHTIGLPPGRYRIRRETMDRLFLVGTPREQEACLADVTVTDEGDHCVVSFHADTIDRLAAHFGTEDLDQAINTLVDRTEASARELLDQALKKGKAH